jgi:hypothetical protein
MLPYFWLILMTAICMGVLNSLGNFAVPALAPVIKVSQVFNWFKEDFTKEGTLRDYLNKFSKTKLSPEAKIEFMDYSWELNNQN